MRADSRLEASALFSCSASESSARIVRFSNHRIEQPGSLVLLGSVPGLSGRQILLKRLAFLSDETIDGHPFRGGLRQAVGLSSQGQ